MSSLRPLITITLLAGVGVFLYMKINETEPALPPGLESWTTGGFELGDATSSNASSTMAPAFDVGTAPPFASASTSAAPKASGDVAPPWTPGPLPVAEAPKIEASVGATADSSPVARSAEAPAATLPEMPALPGDATAQDVKTAPVSPAPSATEAPKYDLATVGAAAGVAGAAAAAIAAENDQPATPPADLSASPATTAPAGASAAAGPTESITPAGDSPVDPSSISASVEPITPTETAEPAANPTSPASMYASVRVAVQGALDRGELAQALLLLSNWYDDPSLTPEETKEVETLLGQLAGSVIYEGPPAHRLEQPYIVQAGESLDDVAEKYNVPAALLAKINGIADPGTLEPGKELKVVRGPFSALVDISERKMTLMLDRRYAGQFAVELDPATTIEEGQWKVDQKLLAPAGPGVYGQGEADGEDRSLLLANLANPNTQAAVVRGPGNPDPVATTPSARVLRLKDGDVNDIYDILSVGSRITVRR